MSAKRRKGQNGQTARTSQGPTSQSPRRPWTLAALLLVLALVLSTHLQRAPPLAKVAAQQGQTVMATTAQAHGSPPSWRSSELSWPRVATMRRQSRAVDAQSEPIVGAASGADSSRALPGQRSEGVNGRIQEVALTIDTYTSMSWKSLKNCLKSTESLVVAAQETHIPQGRIPEPSQWAQRQG